MQCNARRVFWKDSRLQSPETISLRRLDKCAQSCAADASSATRGGNINTYFCNTTVNATLRDGTERGPTDDVLWETRDEPSKREVRGVPALPRGRLGLERRMTSRDSFEIYLSDARPILRQHWFNQYFYHMRLDTYVRLRLFSATHSLTRI